MLEQLHNLASNDITQRPPSFARSICEENSRDLEVNHKINENMPRKFGATRYIPSPLLWTIPGFISCTEVTRKWGQLSHAQNVVT